MKKECKSKNYKLGFTLIEMMVVVLIIGILAAIALPQYRMAVAKARISAILPIMRGWKDALMEYKLQHGDYDYNNASADVLGISWPDDWECFNSLKTECENDYWYCFPNEEATGNVMCRHETNDNLFDIWMFQPDDPECEVCRDKIMCLADGEEGNKVCKALGGKLVDIPWDFDYAYSL